MSFERSYMFVAGTDSDELPDALDSPADAVIVDLEDTVLPSAKETAREESLDKFAEVEPGDTTLILRMNGLDTRFGVDDLEAVAAAEPEAHPEVIIVPDVRDASEVEIVDDILDEHDLDVDIHPLVEKPSALFDAQNIARASDRIHGLTFAAIDFQMNMGMSILDDNDLSVPRFLLSMAANDAGAQAVAPPNLADVHNDERTRSEAEAAKMVGYGGMAAMNEHQAEIINDVFTPSGAEVDRAKGVIDAFEAAGSGLVEIEGALVDKPVVAQLRDTLDRARRAGMDV